MNDNCGTLISLFLVGLGSFSEYSYFNLFSLAFFLRWLHQVHFWLSQEEFVVSSSSYSAFGAIRILSNQPPGKTPHKIKTLYINDNHNHLGFTEYLFEFSSPGSISWETISKFPCKKVMSNLPFDISESVTQADACTDAAVLPIDSSVPIRHFQSKKS